MKVKKGAIVKEAKSGEGGWIVRTCSSQLDIPECHGFREGGDRAAGNRPAPQG